MKYLLVLFSLISDVLIAFWDLESIVHRSVNFINVLVNESDFHETVDSHGLGNDPLILLIDYYVVYCFAWVLLCPNQSVVKKIIYTTEVILRYQL